MFSMLIGIPCSGKSTWLNTQKLEDPACFSVCPDNIREWLTGDMSDQSQNDVVWKIAQHTVNWSIENKLDVILDATNVNTTLRRNFLSRLPLGVEKQALIFEIDPEEAVKRVQLNSNNPLRAKVPPEVIYRMHGEFLYTMKVIEQEGWTKIIKMGDTYGRKTLKV